jgi:hypothetical protein
MLRESTIPPIFIGGAQRDLRRWAHWLELSPVLANGLAVARLDPRADRVTGSETATASGDG